MPGVPIVAAFEPEFHRTMPEHARLYGVPGAWLERASRSTAFTARRTSTSRSGSPRCSGRQMKLVSCHLGGSSSMCAIDRRPVVDTTMGFSPQSGLENASRRSDPRGAASLQRIAPRTEQLGGGGVPDDRPDLRADELGGQLVRRLVDHEVAERLEQEVESALVPRPAQHLVVPISSAGKSRMVRLASSIAKPPVCCCASTQILP